MTARPSGPSPLRTLLQLGSGNVGVTSFLTTLAHTHSRIAHVRLMNEHIYVLNEPELVRTFFVQRGKSIHKAPALRNSNTLLGNGLLTNEGEDWKRQRRLVQPGFHQERIHSYASYMTRAAVERSSQWNDGQSIDVTTEMAAITFEIVTNTLFGGATSDESTEAALALDDVLDSTSRWLLPFGPQLARIPTKGNRKARAGAKLLTDMVWRLIAERRNTGDTGDVLSMLIFAEDEDGTVMADQQIVDEVMTLVLAGHETTAMTLSWVWMLLSRNPEALALLHAELASVLVEEHPATVDDVAKLAYTRSVVAESLRMYPPAWILGRKITEDIELDGWTIPKSSTVTVSPWVLQRDGRWWVNGEQFNPARWINDDGKFDDKMPGQPDGSWLPFGMGSRKCVGQMFAWTESVLVLAELARRWNVDVTTSGPIDVTPAITLRPKHGLTATVSHR